MATSKQRGRERGKEKRGHLRGIPKARKKATVAADANAIAIPRFRYLCLQVKLMQTGQDISTLSDRDDRIWLETTIQQV